MLAKEFEKRIFWARKKVAKKKELWKGEFHFHVGGKIDLNLKIGRASCRERV